MGAKHRKLEEISRTLARKFAPALRRKLEVGTLFISHSGVKASCHASHILLPCQIHMTAAMPERSSPTPVLQLHKFSPAAVYCPCPSDKCCTLRQSLKQYTNQSLVCLDNVCPDRWLLVYIKTGAPRGPRPFIFRKND